MIIFIKYREDYILDQPGLTLINLPNLYKVIQNKL
jgi:hypothetical protein